jgi:hypothetical protein
VHAFPILHLVGSPESDLHAPPYSSSIRQRTRQHFRDCWPCQHRSHIVAPCRLRVPSGRDAPPEVSSSLCRQDSRRYYILRARLSHVAKPYEQMFLGFTLTEASPISPFLPWRRQILRRISQHRIFYWNTKLAVFDPARYKNGRNIRQGRPPVWSCQC